MNNTELNTPTLEDHDRVRLGKQRTKVLDAVLDGEWHTLAELSKTLGFPEASISARLRDFRKVKYGAYTVDRRRVSEGSGQWEYRLTYEV